MKVLFDQNVPRDLAKHLQGHQVTRAFELDLQEVRNGDLLTAAEQGGFDVLLSCDRNLEYQNKIVGKKIAVIVLSTNNWSVMETHLEPIVQALDAAKHGTYHSVDCGSFVAARRRRRNNPKL